MPLVVPKEEWKRIEKWTNRDKEDPHVARRREYVNYLDATSRAMTKQWPNSLENVNKRNEEVRRARLAAAEESNNRFYKRYVKRKHEEQERLMFSARDTVFKNKDAPKLLLSAVIETVIQKERMEQVKFLEQQRRLAGEQRRREADDVDQRAADWRRRVALNDARRRDANNQHQREIVEQAKEVAERKRNEYEAELNRQKIDNIKAKEQIEALKKFEDEFKAAEKARIWSDMERSRLEAEQRRREQDVRDQVDDRLLQVLLQSRARIDQKRKQTEKDMKEEKCRVLEAISQKLDTGDAARDAKELEMLKKAVAEKEAIAEARRQAEAEKNELMKQERVQVREQFLRDEARHLQHLNTVRQWEIMNRFKNDEVYEDYQQQARLEKQKKIKEYREDILKLWKEREDREARELSERRHFYGDLALSKVRAADDKLLAHAAHLLAEARHHRRPDHALRRTLDRYCKMHRLYPPPPAPSALQRRFPSAPASRALDTLLYNDKRDGLEQDGLAIPAVKPKVADAYARSGPANGLQRRPSQDDQLPPIKVVPCKTDSCQCELKQGK